MSDRTDANQSVTHEEARSCVHQLTAANPLKARLRECAILREYIDQQEAAMESLAQEVRGHWRDKYGRIKP